MLNRLLVIIALITFPLTIAMITIYFQQPSYAMIFSNKVTVYSGPSKTQKTLFYIHEGVDFELMKESNQWANIRFSNGLSGWVELKYIHKI